MNAIIPCCGFGTRMGMTYNSSKEMLPDPENNSAPIIEYSLNICEQFNIAPIVIVRKEKIDLIDYLNQHQIEYMIYEPKSNEEWNHTVLASQSLWLEDSLLILPDTRFSRFKCIEDIQRGLKLGNNAVMALHEVTDPSKWGIIRGNTLFEKPKQFPEGLTEWAWGLIGFKDTYGQELFSNVQSLELRNVGFTFLNKFEDLTRGSK